MGRARVNKEEIKEVEQEPVLEEIKEVEYVIEVLNKEYTGIAATVLFHKGIGTTKNKYIAEYFEKRGAKITKK